VTDPATSPDVPRPRDADDAPAPGERDANDAAPHADRDTSEVAPDGALAADSAALAQRVSSEDVAASETSPAPGDDLGTGDAGLVEPPPAAATPPVPRPRDRRLGVAFLAFVLGLVIVLGAYVAVNGAALRTLAAPKHFGPAQLQVPRGQASAEPGRIVVQAPGQDVMIVSVATDFRARELGLVEWDVAGLPANAQVMLLFNSDYTPRRAHQRPLAVDGGRALPLSLAGDRDWLGRITGLALVVRAPGARLDVRGVSVKPESALQLVADRVREWFAYERWSGTSINAVTGGAPAQSLPMPVPVALAMLVGALLLALLHRFAPARWPVSIVTGAALVFLVAWASLDLRWSANLARQVAETVDRFGGKSDEDRRLAAEDAELAAFVERARAAMPADPQRVFVLAEAHYFRGRAAWHLLPHRAWWAPVSNDPPQEHQLRTGDYVLVWQRPGVQYDAPRKFVRFDNGVERPARMVMNARGAALIEIL
jgi:hypothetical protein